MKKIIIFFTIVFLICSCKTPNNNKVRQNVFLTIELENEFKKFKNKYSIYGQEFYVIYFISSEDISILKYSKKQQMVPDILQKNLVGVINNERVLIVDTSQNNISKTFFNVNLLEPLRKDFFNYPSCNNYIPIWDYKIKKNKILLTNKIDSLRVRGYSRE